MAKLWFLAFMVTVMAAWGFMKEATNIVGEAPEKFSELTGWLGQLFSNPYMICAVFFEVLFLISYTFAISRLKLSYIYTLSQAAQLVLIVVFGLLLFEEKVTLLGWLGIVTICIGLFLMSMPRKTSESKL